MTGQGHELNSTWHENCATWRLAVVFLGLLLTMNGCSRDTAPTGDANDGDNDPVLSTNDDGTPLEVTGTPEDEEQDFPAIDPDDQAIGESGINLNGI